MAVGGEGIAMVDDGVDVAAGLDATGDDVDIHATVMPVVPPSLMSVLSLVLESFSGRAVRRSAPAAWAKDGSGGKGKAKGRRTEGGK